VVDNAKSEAAGWNALIASLGLAPRRISGVSLYRLSADLLGDYRAPEYCGFEMERRAIRGRLAAIVTATDDYLRAGFEPSSISEDRLIALDLLPREWQHEPGKFSDLQVLPWKNGGITIVELGSRSAVADTLAKFGDDANVVYLPFPHIAAGTDGLNPLAIKLHNALLPPAAMPVDGESMEFFGLAFDRERLHKTAEYIAHLQPHKSKILNLARR